MARSMTTYRRTSNFEIEQRPHLSIVVNQIDEYIKSDIQVINNFQVNNDRETYVLLTVTNSFTDDLQAVVFLLTRSAIRSYKNGHYNTNSVTQIAKNFSNYIYSIQKSTSCDIATLKQALISGLEGIKKDSRQLYQLVHNNEALRNNLVTAIDNIFFTVKKLYCRITFETKSPQELKDLEFKLKLSFTNTVRSITQEDDETFNNFRKYIVQALLRMYKCVLMIVEEITGFDDQTKMQLAQIVYSVSQSLAIIENTCRTQHEVAFLATQDEYCGRLCINEMITLLDLIDTKNSNTEVDSNLRNLILHVTAHQFALADAIIAGVVRLGEN